MFRSRHLPKFNSGRDIPGERYCSVCEREAGEAERRCFRRGSENNEERK